MLSTNQDGFRSGLSTSLAVYDRHEKFLQNKEKGLTTFAVFCDLSKAGVSNIRPPGQIRPVAWLDPARWMIL